MPFDALATAAVTDEVLDRGLRARIQKILQPSASSIGLQLYRDGWRSWLLVSVDAERARVQFTAATLAKAFAVPSSFVMLLRKHLEGRFFSSVESAPGERVLRLQVDGGEQGRYLVIEVMGRYSNLFLLDEGDRVLGSLKMVSRGQSRTRSFRPGSTYTPLKEQSREEDLYPPGSRIDPYREPQTFLDLFPRAPAETPVRAALVGLLLGCGPFLADQVALRAQIDPKSRVAAAEADGLLESASHLYQLYQSRKWEPHTFASAKCSRDFAPYLPVGVPDAKPAETISLAIEEALGQGESADVLASSRRALLQEIEKRKRRAERQIDSLRKGLEAADRADEVMEQGQLLLAYQHDVERGSSDLHIPELGIDIPLDPKQSPQENAERLFKRYRKLRDARRKIPALMQRAKVELERLHDAATFAELAGAEADLRELRRELGLEKAKPAAKERRGAGARKIPSFSIDGYRVLVGRNAQENERVTFREARRQDLWMHARGRTGAHVILRREQNEPDEAVIGQAAALAAYFSEGRSDTRVDVDVTEARNVRKIPGASPGRVTYKNFRTVRVEPRPPKQPDNKRD